MGRFEMSIKDQVITIIADQAMLEPSDIKMDNTLADLGIDSLGLVESIFAIEESFDITVPFNANEPSNSDFDIRKSIPHNLETSRCDSEKDVVFCVPHYIEYEQPNVRQTD